MENYETLGVIGEGTYGVVMKARHRETGQLVAIKKFKESDEDEQVRKTSLREVRVLKQLRHDNIISLLEVFRRKGKLYLVFEYVDKTILEVLEQRPNGLDENDVRRFTYQLLRGTEYCHAHNIMHRDIKPENILISKNGTLKLCDFGFARTMSIGGKYTDYVATRWYRSPELLVGDTEYTKGVDIWAVGCIFAEISNGMPLFPGESDLDQLAHIMRCFGKLTTRQIQTFRRNPLYVGVELPNPKEQETLDARFPSSPKPWLQFLKACLKNDPEQRENCSSLMNLPYFTENNFRADFDQELRMLFEKEQRVLQTTASRSTKASSAVSLTQQPEQPLPNPTRSESPAVATPPALVAKPLLATKPAAAAPNVPSIGTLWSQYLASTTVPSSLGANEQLPDLGTKVQALQTQHPLFAGGMYYRSDQQASSSAPTPPTQETILPRHTGPATTFPSAYPASTHQYHTQPAPNPSLTMTATSYGGRGQATYLPPTSSQANTRPLFPSLSSNTNLPPPSPATVANASLGLNYKKKPAKKTVLSTLSLGAYGTSSSPTMGSSSAVYGATQSNPYTFATGSSMVLQGHHTGSTMQPPPSQQGARRTSKPIP